MKKKTASWSVDELERNFSQIHFPEYQREPNVWSLDAKQRLIDSMLREFDISSFYFYDNDNQTMECVDGRQRIGAIMSFLGCNPNDQHNKFAFRTLNELYVDTSPPFATLDNLRYRGITELADANNTIAAAFVAALRAYTLTIVRLSHSGDENEFHLQFTRLNLGTIINSGERLNAMVGDIRDVCFEELGRHDFLAASPIRTHRYAREQLAAQILAQVFSLELTGAETGERQYGRTRHEDMQRLFKQYATLSDRERGWIEKVTRIMGLLLEGFATLPRQTRSLRSRALVVSIVLLAYERDITTADDAQRLATFIDDFVCRLQWQIRRGLDVDPPYRYLVEFQRHLAQASVERQAVEARATLLAEQYHLWSNTAFLRGDEEYARLHPGLNPREECRRR